MVKGVLLAAVLLLSLPLQALTQLSASVDKNPALRGEAVTLEVTANTRVAADAINFRVLEQDFTVMVPSVSTSTQIINGQSSQSTIWRVVLLPKKAGNYTIPAFTLQGLNTQPISLEVLNETAQTNNNNNAELFLQANIEQQQLYVQQLSYYQVTIYFNGELQRGSLSEPQMDGASAMQVGQDAESTELVNGIRYRTITRRYAITPQRSGSFTITPPTFSGEMIDRDSARYNYFARTKTVVQQAEPIDVVVNAIPANFPGSWLVAGLVTLTEEWSPDITELKQGEPVTRIITLSAVDVAENQLPDLTQGFPEGLRLYQEQPQAKSAERNGRLVAQKIFTTAVIANTPGELELPEVSLAWWNSQTNKLEHARLPARTLSVAEVAGAAEQTSTISPALNITAPLTAPTGSSEASPWQWNYTSSALLALWLLTLFTSYVVWRLKAPVKPVIPTPSRVRFNSAELKRACKQGDTAAAKAELLRFAHQQLDKRCQSLTEVSAYIHSAELKNQLIKLNAALYGNSHAWQGEPLWQAWQQYNASRPEAGTADKLQPLYPQ
ncbi:hypothetical protein M2404_001802 [Rheinheimera pacifica]|uniref:BatD family protein n=1 Tax=Rheinheimera pacifica TaxID=173990 RepID=UPI00216A7FFD|nr:BatD family protein [Rheinheimera pacifica]MCS4307468.1 hypothetical protein [Rheinheimera pacifica]